MIEIRLEEKADSPFIRSVVLTAFRNNGEPDLVEALHAANSVTLSLVAVEEGKVVGHVLFSPVSSEFDLFGKHFLGLAPLAVAPNYQKRGIGSKLVRRGLELALAGGWDAVFVLGSPAYYARFGFARVDDWNLICESPVSTAEFLAVTLKPHGLDGCGGLVSYHPLFKEFGILT
jgi:putative acetyltransferase